MLKSLYNSQSIQPYRTPSGGTIGRHKTGGASNFSSSLANAITRNLKPTQISSNSPLVRFGPPISAPPSTGGRYPGATPTTPNPTPPSSVRPPSGTAPAVPETGAPHDFEAQKVGQVDRAPMAFFEHNGELVISGITRNGINKTPVWTYNESTGVRQRSILPEAAESGATGYSTGGSLHLTPESWGGAIDYTATNPDGPWEKHDYTHLVPHDYTNLKWGFSYQCPVTGKEFMGFGNGKHPGMVISRENGEWQLFSGPKDMLFPTGVGVINTGANKGTTLVSSCTYGRTVVHVVEPDGSTRKVKELGSWGVLRADHRQRVNYLSGEEGKVYWSSFDNPDEWKECKYNKPSGPVGKIEPIQGEPNIHPDTGTMIFPGMGKDGTALYEARREGNDIVLDEVLWLPGIGEWSIKTAVVNGDFYLGTGKQTGQAADRTPGVIYKVELDGSNYIPRSA